MSFKDILVALTTYPEPTPASAVEDAVDLAVALGARIRAFPDTGIRPWWSHQKHARAATRGAVPIPFKRVRDPTRIALPGGQVSRRGSFNATAGSTPGLMSAAPA
jgi:hypothetical protein